MNTLNEIRKTELFADHVRKNLDNQWNKLTDFAEHLDEVCKILETNGEETVSQIFLALAAAELYYRRGVMGLQDKKKEIASNN